MAAATKGRKRRRAKQTSGSEQLDALPAHALYEAAVQNVEADADFIERVYRKARGKAPRRLREDFCGTASLAAHWVTRHRDNRAWGVDLDQPTLDWGQRHRVDPVGRRARHVHLLRGDVLDPHRPRVDVQVAFNFSYFVFHDREALGRYFRSVHASLRRQGVFFLDLFGGTESLTDLEEVTEVEAQRDPAGWELPAFDYVWEQSDFNPIDHRIRCHIHFRFGKGRERRRAFTYDWRFWMLPELRELLANAGFAKTQVYVEGWDDDEECGDGVFRKRKRFDNEGGWLAYIAAFR
ncbi:MAG: class I SAM-dependent methyltransferase [Acidobacteria bacterium]|nr:MAG: class I SAM-dependent methyltransferase [Acidobacteriota bacterium]REK04267.1 MAG: class I SAM-dependent methyltransferase [Acidobacteriota bacterium]